MTAERSPRRLKVVAVLPAVHSMGGAEFSFVMAAPLLRREGVELHLVVLSASQDLVPRLEAEGVVIHDLSGSRGVIGQVRALRRVIRSIRPDLVHASLFEAAAPAQLATLGTRVPVLVTWANTNYLTSRAAEPGTSARSLRLLRWTEMVLARLSRSHFHAVTAAVGVHNGRALHVDPSFVHVGERGRDPADYEWRGERTQGVDGSFVLLAVGRIDHQKAYPALVAAVDELCGRRSSLELWIAGREGSGSGQLAEAIGRMRHPDAVRLLGQRDDVPALLARADAVVCASWREGAAGALIEAMAVGTPIVSVQIEGLDGVLVDGVNAVVVPRSQLVDGIERLVDDRDLGHRLAATARSEFESRFTLQASIERLVEIYRIVAGA